jgi:hypothetical protein
MRKRVAMVANLGRTLEGITSTMTYGQMRRAISTKDVTVASALLPENREGCYDEATRTILIDRTMTYTQKRCALMHELIHWVHADISREDRIEQRTRRETALKLISTIDYMSAEFMYDGDIYQIACELDVTVRVVKDYQQILAKHAPQQYLKRG